jgi:hypothetical protein
MSWRSIINFSFHEPLSWGILGAILRTVMHEVTEVSSLDMTLNLFFARI